MWKDKIKQAWNDHPIETIVVISLAVTAAAKFIDATSAAQGRRAYARQIDYKVRNRM